MPLPRTKQNQLNAHQLEAFYSDRFTNDQVLKFLAMTSPEIREAIRVVVDIGGGCGHFAKQLTDTTRMRVRVIDSDEHSLEHCMKNYGDKIQAEKGDALNPTIHGDEDMASFNLILHHLVGCNEIETRQFQISALNAWTNQAKLIFVNEYVYDSYINDLSGRLIYEITKNTFFSAIGRFVSIFFPSLRANTFGTGVRFRSHAEWLKLFNEAGYFAFCIEKGSCEQISIPRKLLLIKRKRRDYFLLQPISSKNGRHDQH